VYRNGSQAHGYGKLTINSVVQKDAHCLYEIAFEQQVENIMFRGLKQWIATLWVCGGVACGHENKRLIANVRFSCNDSD
jgi:hypothetical protein